MVKLLVVKILKQTSMAFKKSHGDTLWKRKSTKNYQNDKIVNVVGLVRMSLFMDSTLGSGSYHTQDVYLKWS
jgi:hypothetical protein